MVAIKGIRLAAMAALLRFVPSQSHGVMTLPESTRQHGSLAKAGSCEDYECFWFSHLVEIPGEPTVNEEAFRTFNIHVSSGAHDWSRKNPWRAPGTAPVFGSGCGSAGGGSAASIEAAAYSPPGVAQGTDGTQLPAREPAVWRQGAVEEVAWAITANHGGGYSYRLCPADGNVTEACFQRHMLRFVGDKHWIQYGNLTLANGSVLKMPRFEIPRVLVRRGTHPAGSEWARNPIPSCLVCDQAMCDKHDLACAQACSGDGLVACPPSMTQFPEPLPGLNGFVPTWGNNIKKKLDWGSFPFSIVDQVAVPDDLPKGDYLLSWRWDCEQSSQVWQNCADVRVVGSRRNTNSAVGEPVLVFP